MAKTKPNRVKMECQECKHTSYFPNKSKAIKTRLELMKHCKFCKKHTKHKETK